MTITHVKAHTKGKPDPFESAIEANRPRYCRKWGIEIGNSETQKPVALSRLSLSEIATKLMDLAKSVGYKSNGI